MQLTHFDKEGKARMVDVTGKVDSSREAVARGTIFMKPDTLALIQDRRITKGDVFEVARVAGIMAAKRTPDLIPLCHPLPVSSVTIDFSADEERASVEITAVVKVKGPTGVEMEALTAVSVAALTVYDMCKAVDREMIIGEIMLMEKKGGKSGHFRRKG